MNFNDLPAGLTVQMSLSDIDATNYAVSYLKSHDPEIKELIKQKLKISLDITDPEIKFGENELCINCRTGLKFVKAKASAKADVKWDGKKALVNVKSIDLPIISIEPSKANTLIQLPIERFISQLQEAFKIQSFRVEPGRISVSAVKK